MNMSESANQQLSRRVRALRGARELLGVTEDADVPDLTRAYRRQALGLHPDRSSDPEATQQFQALHAAYRLALDAALHAPAPAAPPRAHDGPSPHAPRSSAPDDGVWVVAGPVHVQPPRHTDITSSPREGPR
jgi:hypothetical protein